MERQILHVDVNNAFLSWTAVEMLKQGSKIDIREIPSVIGGDETKRAGIVLAKSPKNFWYYNRRNIISSKNEMSSTAGISRKL